MNKRHEIIENIFLEVCKAYDIEDWKILCKTKLVGKKREAKCVLIILLSKYLRVPLGSVGDYVNVRLRREGCTAAAGILHNIKTNLSYLKDPIQKISFIIENKKQEGKYNYIIQKSKIIKYYDFSTEKS